MHLTEGGKKKSDVVLFFQEERDFVCRRKKKGWRKRKGENSGFLRGEGKRCGSRGVPGSRIPSRQPFLCKLMRETNRGEERKRQKLAQTSKHLRETEKSIVRSRFAFARFAFFFPFLSWSSCKRRSRTVSTVHEKFPFQLPCFDPNSVNL